MLDQHYVHTRGPVDQFLEFADSDALDRAIDLLDTYKEAIYKLCSSYTIVADKTTVDWLDGAAGRRMWSSREVVESQRRSMYAYEQEMELVCKDEASWLVALDAMDKHCPGEPLLVALQDYAFRSSASAICELERHLRGCGVEKYTIKDCEPEFGRPAPPGTEMNEIVFPSSEAADKALEWCDRVRPTAPVSVIGGTRLVVDAATLTALRSELSEAEAPSVIDTFVAQS